MKRFIRKQLNWKFIFKIDLPALMAFALFAGLIFFYLIPGFETAMMDRKRVLIHEMTSSAYSILEYYNSLEKKGILSTEEAREKSRSVISSIRYGETFKDYFWITDRYPRMIEHPYKPELNGKDLSNFRDSKDKRIFVEFVNAVSSTGESYVDYMWQWNDDSTRIVPKLSYVKLFEPWGWIIGTGIYVDDVREEIHRVELRAFVISGVIGIIIIILLILISGQSHKTDQKRKKAEEELRKSRELYRTLAEAASEGVAIWSDQGLQANKTMLSWLGYSEEELQNTTLKEIFTSPEIHNINDPVSLYAELLTTRYVECILTMKNGNHIKSYADFSRILLEGHKAIMLVARPVKGLTDRIDFTPQNKLLNDIGSGFFRTTFGNKNRFTYLSEPMAEILGFIDTNDLLSHSFESIFADKIKHKAFKSALTTNGSVFRNVVLLRKKDKTEFWALVSITEVEINSQEKWYEGTIEKLAVYSSGLQFCFSDLQTYSTAFIMKAPVSAFMNSVINCYEGLSVAGAVSLMKDNHVRHLIVNDKNDEPIGVISAAIIGIKLGEGGTTDTEVFRWMNSPPDYINYKSSVNEATAAIQNSAGRCLLVTNDKRQLIGIITDSEISQPFFSSPDLIIPEIREATTAPQLHEIYLKSTRIAVSMVLGAADPYSVSLFISTVADTICGRVLDLCIKETGNPPCRFAFIQTGSAGRREQTFVTDQDNAIIFENKEGLELDIAYKYFLDLGKRINLLLSQIGFSLCKGGNMAGNPKWCQPLKSWKKYFSDWIKMPGPSELLEVSIFFDFRFCYGDTTLSDQLREFINKDIKTNDIFFHHMSLAWKQFNPSVSILNESTTDIKKLLMPLTGIVRLYTLKYGLNSYSSIDRVLEMYSNNNLSYSLLRELIRTWKDLSYIRLTHQASCLAKGTEPDNLVDFLVVDADLYYFAEQSIKTINNLILQTGSDFYTELI